MLYDYFLLHSPISRLFLETDPLITMLHRLLEGEIQGAHLFHASIPALGRRISLHTIRLFLALLFRTRRVCSRFHSAGAIPSLAKTLSSFSLSQAYGKMCRSSFDPRPYWNADK